MIQASKKVTPWRTDEKEAALECYNSGALNLPVRADIEFVFPRPKSHYGTGKNADVLKPSAPKYCISRGNGDIDKLANEVNKELPNLMPDYLKAIDINGRTTVGASEMKISDFVPYISEFA